MRLLSEKLQREGCKPYVIPRGGSVPVGATGYVAFVPELIKQLDEAGAQGATLYLGTGSTGTHSGVLAGLTACNAKLTVQGISVSRPADQQRRKVLELTNATLNFLGLTSHVTEADIQVDDRFRGPGYGIPTEATMEAIAIAAQDEGLILDPVYTGKTMAGLIGHVTDGRVREGETLVFVHTGGAPALFAYNRETAEALGH